MSYLDQANLADDPKFHRRLAAAVSGESALKVDDFLADMVLRSPTNGANMFMPLVAAAPGFAAEYAAGGSDAITDGEILSAVQASWTRVTGLYEPVPIEPVP